jgi:hypothetical protein
MRLVRTVFCVLSVVFFTPIVSASAPYSVADGFPKAASGSFGVVAAGLPDGRWIVWNGDAVFVQNMRGANSFHQIASGYSGDPGFISVSPNGHEILLGGGYSGKVYILDVNAPANYAAGSEIVTRSHYYGAFLSEKIILLDCGTSDGTTSELVAFDVTAASGAPRRVMLKPAQSGLTGSQYGVSACLAVNASHSMLYLMSNIYEGWSLVGNELKRIPVADVVNAYETSTVLDWTSDATAIGVSGSFAGGGPVGVTAFGELVIGGFGGVQLVDPASLIVLDTIDPAGAYEYYGASYNAATGEALAIVADPADYSMDVVYAPSTSFAPMPVLGGMALFVLIAMLALAGWRANYRFNG